MVKGSQSKKLTTYEQYVLKLNEINYKQERYKTILPLLKYIGYQLEHSQGLPIPAIELNCCLYEMEQCYRESPVLAAVMGIEYCKTLVTLIKSNQDNLEFYTHLNKFKKNTFFLTSILDVIKAMMAEGHSLADARLVPLIAFLKKPFAFEQSLKKEEFEFLVANFRQDNDLMEAILNSLSAEKKKLYYSELANYNALPSKTEIPESPPDSNPGQAKQPSEAGVYPKILAPVPLIFYQLLDAEALKIYEEFYRNYCKKRESMGANKKNDFETFIVKHYFEFAYLIHFFGNQPAFAFFNHLLGTSIENLISFFAQYQITKYDYPDSVLEETIKNFDRLKHFLLVSHHFENLDLMQEEDFMPLLDAYFEEKNSQRTAEGFAIFIKTYHQKSQTISANLAELIGKELADQFFNELLKNSIFNFENFLKDYEPLRGDITSYLKPYTTPLQILALKRTLQILSLLQIIKVTNPSENLISQFGQFLDAFYSICENNDIALRKIMNDHSAAIIRLMAEEMLGDKAFILLAEITKSSASNLEIFLKLHLNTQDHKENLSFFIENFNKYFSHCIDRSKTGKVLIQLFFKDKFNKDEPIDGKVLLELARNMMFHPDDFKELIAYFSRLNYIGIMDNGEAEENWSNLAYYILTHAGTMLSKNASELSKGLLQAWEKSQNLNTSSLEKIDMLQIARDYRFVKFLNRSIMLEKKADSAVDPSDKVYLTLKIRKKDEAFFELPKQDNAVQFLRENSNNLGLKSIFPIPEGAVKILNLRPFLQDLIEQEKISEQECQKFYSTLDNSSAEYEAYRCQALEEDSTYIHEPHLPVEKVVTGLTCFIWDAIKMLEIAIIYYQPIDLLHNNNLGRRDSGLYHPLTNLTRYVKTGGGRINAWENGVQYPNISPLGLRDQGDCCHIQKFLDRGFSLEQHQFEELHNTFAREPHLPNFILAHFIANFIMSIDLLIDTWVIQQHRQFPDLHKEELEQLWQMGVSMKQELYIIAFIAWTGLPADIARGFVSEIHDKDHDKKQAMYWLYPEEYLEDIQHNTIRPGVYAETTQATVKFDRLRKGTFQTQKDEAQGSTQLGFSMNRVDADRGAVNGQDPHKEAEKTRYHLISFGFAGRNAVQNSQKFCKKGHDHFEKGDYEAAQEYYQKAIEFNPYNLASRKALVEMAKKMQESSSNPNNNDILHEHQRHYAGSIIKRTFREWKENQCQENQTEAFTTYGIKK
jgi:hypothetical protein